MGMFDWLHCKMPLPGGPRDANTLRFQTKSIAPDLGGTMDEYTVAEDGRLWGEDYDIVDRSDPDATGLAGLAGLLTRENVRPRAMDGWTGRVSFYTDYGIKDANGWGGRWVEYEADIENGYIKSIRLVMDGPNPFV